MAGERFVVKGGNPLNGTIRVSGAKNAALPCMAAALLTAGDCILENVPAIEDVRIMGEVLRSLGMDVQRLGDGKLKLNASALNTYIAPSHLVTQNRASFLVMGPLLARLGRAESCPPGGDVLGQRPIDVHLAGFAALGAEVFRQEERYAASAKQLQGARIFMDYPSHIGTENVLMAACRARGKTVIKNASQEPEVLSLAGMLLGMGAKIEGAGSNTIVVEGVEELHEVSHRIPPDRIEAGTFAIAAAITKGDVTIEDAEPEHMDSLCSKLAEAGAEVRTGEGTVSIKGRSLSAVNVQALPYPGFATDLQAAMGVLLTQASGVSVLHERVYDNRLLYVGELRKMGAEIVVAGQTAIISGPIELAGTPVRALDIRCGAALVLAGLAARGTTEVADIYHLKRGYEGLDEKLRGVGADIRYCN